MKDVHSGDWALMHTSDAKMIEDELVAQGYVLIDKGLGNTLVVKASSCPAKVRAC